MNSTWRIQTLGGEQTVVLVPQTKQSPVVSPTQRLLPIKLTKFQKAAATVVVVPPPRVQRIQPSSAEYRPILPKSTGSFVPNLVPYSSLVTVPSTTQFVCQAPPNITTVSHAPTTFQYVNESTLEPGAYLIDDPQVLQPESETPPLLEAEETVYVNPRQLPFILKRRAQRQKLVAEGRIPKERSKYMHQSRHLQAISRTRGKRGQFENLKKVVVKVEERESSEEPEVAEGLQKFLVEEYMKMPMKIPETNGTRPGCSKEQQPQKKDTVVKLNGSAASRLNFIPLSKYKSQPL